MSSSIDIVTVYHNKINYLETLDLEKRLLSIEPECKFYGHSNIEKNLGFAKGCNRAASFGDSPVIGFLNPDVEVHRKFSHLVLEILSNNNIVITGNRFDKSDKELKVWGLKDWVCGATFFVKRDFFESVGGFDERYVWSWEETHMIRQAQSLGFGVKSFDLPISHSSPIENSLEDSDYKNRYFNLGQKIYFNHWGRS